MDPSISVSHGKDNVELAENIEIEKSFAGLFRRLSSLTNTLVRQATKPSHLTALQWGVLLVLFQKGPCPLREISKVLHIDRSSLQELTERLVRSKLVVRSVMISDRRVPELTLTAKGRDLMLAHVEAMVSVQELLVGNIDSEALRLTQATLHEILDRHGF